MAQEHPYANQAGARLVKAIREIPPEYHAISGREVYEEFKQHARSEKKNFIVLLGCVLLQGGVAGGTLYLLKVALDRYFETRTMATVLFLIGTLFLSTVFKSTLEFLFNWRKAVVVARIHDKLVVRTFRDLLMNPFHFHIRERDRKKYGWVLKDSIKFIESAFGIFNAWGKQPFVLLSTITALWIMSPLLTLVGIVIVPLGIPCIIFIKGKVRAFIAERKMLLGTIEEIVSESIRSIRIVKVLGLEARNVDQLQTVIDKQRDINMKNAFYLGLMSPLSEFLGFFGLTVIIFAGSQRLIAGQFTTGTFLVFIMAFLNVYRPLKDISNGFMNYQLALDAGRRLILLRQAAGKEEEKMGTRPLDLFGQLQIRGLWFSYHEQPEEDEQYILRDLSLDLRAGETVALVGPTGAGKSTLCDLICRLYRPQKGSLLINGAPIHAYSQESYTRRIALCSQETIVFSNTLMEEIRIADPGVSRAEVLEVAEAVGLSLQLHLNARDWDTWTGDRGVQFSGGQRQMIAMARALLRKPQVLILDEAMSGLDAETCRRIWANVRRLLPATAVLVISHNWDMIRHCDRVLMLTQGQIGQSMPTAAITDKDRFFEALHKTPP